MTSEHPVQNGINGHHTPAPHPHAQQSYHPGPRSRSSSTASDKSQQLTRKLSFSLRASDFGITKDERLTAEEMDSLRNQATAYEYLCHLEEAKRWIEACINEELPPSVQLEEGLQNGVFLAKLAHFFNPKVVPIRKVYDKDQKKYEQKGLHFKHTDNINHFFKAMEETGLPTIFYPETTDIYDRKNMPKTIYCVHALSLFLFRLGIAPQIQDLYGKVEFTEEEISNMQKELDKYGIQMPQFHKIGGILANEMSVDEAALHAAIIAINEALDKDVVEETFSTLQNPNACLNGITQDNAEEYQNRLKEAKRVKCEAALSKSKDDLDDRDIYEELLTHAELQGNLNKINLDVKLETLARSLAAGNEEELFANLRTLGINDLNVENKKWYLEQLANALKKKREETGDENATLDKDEIQAAINEANILAMKHRQMLAAVAAINDLLREDGDPHETMQALQKTEAQLPEVVPDYPSLYHDQLVELKKMKEDQLGENILLTHDDLSSVIPHLSALARLNKALDIGTIEEIWTALNDPEIGVTDLEESNRSRTCEALRKVKATKNYLTLLEVQETVVAVNQQIQEEQDRIKAVSSLNDAMDSGDVDTMKQALLDPKLQLENFEPKNLTHYVRLLQKKKEEKSKETGDPNPALWIEEIQGCINEANRQTQIARKQVSAVTAVNIAVEGDDWEQTFELIRHQDLGLSYTIPECAQTYHEQLQEIREDKVEEGCKDETWVAYETQEGYNYYFNTETLEGSWDKPDELNENPAQLTRDEIKECVDMVSAAYDRAQLWRDNEDVIIKLQSFSRMYLARKAYKDRLAYIESQLPAIIMIQSHWRGYVQRSKYLDRLEYFRNNIATIIKLQKWARMWLARSRYKTRLEYLASNARHIIRIQAWFRSNKARHDYKTLTGAENPPLSVVQKFVHLLDQRDKDFAEEIELQELKKKVVQYIKSNNELETALNTMDIKIGLLVKNRITLQDVVNHSRNLRKKKEQQASEISSGLKSLNKQNRVRLEAYQHLFYLLQTNPTYFGKLIFKMASGRTTNFMQSVILSVYNYAANVREEYLLLKLFKTALQEEIEFISRASDGSELTAASKVDKVKEIATGNPLVIKMVVTFNRGSKGQSSLREILSPQVQYVMKDKALNINMSPVEIYKAWIGQKETETGEASDLPYEVTTEQALQHDEIKKRVEDSIEQLRLVTEKFLGAILGSVEKIPYGLRYIAKCLKNLLKEKFPDTPEDEVLKMVGNLIYYRYMNPAIVAPDGFDIIDVTAGAAGLNADQRRNLGSIAKVLQFASTGKTFAGDMEHLKSINKYLSEAYERFKKFFALVCEVPEPEEKYNMDEYSDAVALSKPVIFISIREILDTHKLLLEHEDEIAPDPNDALHETLEELGDVPEIAQLVGGDTSQASGEGEQDEKQLEQLGNTEVSLTLLNRIEVKEDDDGDVRNVLLRTKRMIIDVIRVQPGDNLVQLLETEATDHQQEEHMANIQKLEEREKQKKAADEDGKNMLKMRSLLTENKLPLEDMKRRIAKNLEILEQHNIVKKENKYQAIVNMIARDIRNQRRYRQRRKQELTKLKQNMSMLDQKSKFFEEQSEYYNQYIKSCLASLANKSKKKQKTKKKIPGIKYTASELHRKKVLLEIEGLDTNQFRNVMFEIGPSEGDLGKFDVSAKFMGVNMEKVSVVFQDLLQLQYEGVAVMKMFEGRAKINVNLLIFLLNKKFYGK
uniref:ras GTPase-activating-like protein IQGAP1 isoform X2 n=1 Tax=Styela clava TaxID=7725 RepID=UPI00193AA31E|nr:ras GTPase-activating-like protein IQGAP1 isoform X2 [Styela clava]